MDALDTITKLHESRRAYISEVAELYFGEREAGLPPRTHEELRLPAWRGVQAAIVALLRTGRLAEHFPAHGCPDSPRAIIGTDENHFYGALQGEHPDIEVPLNPDTPPETVPVLELFEFCYRHTSKPRTLSDHPFFAHYHYADFSTKEGQLEFADQINSIFRRHRLAYDLKADGQVQRPRPSFLPLPTSSARSFPVSRSSAAAGPLGALLRALPGTEPLGGRCPCAPRDRLANYQNGANTESFSQCLEPPQAPTRRLRYRF